MINNFLLYLILKLDAISIILGIAIAVCIVLLIVFLILYFIDLDVGDEAYKIHGRFAKKLAIPLCILVLLIALIPTTEDAIVLLINNNITTDNMNTVVNTLKDSVDYVVNAISTIK